MAQRKRRSGDRESPAATGKSSSSKRARFNQAGASSCAAAQKLRTMVLSPSPSHPVTLDAAARALKAAAEEARAAAKAPEAASTLDPEAQDVVMRPTGDADVDWLAETIFISMRHFLRLKLKRALGAQEGSADLAAKFPGVFHPWNDEVHADDAARHKAQ